MPTETHAGGDKSFYHARFSLGDLTHQGFGQTSVALPIFEGRSLTGFVVYGVHRDGTNLDPDELETLDRLCDAAAQAYTYIEVSRYRAERAQLVPARHQEDHIAPTPTQR